MELDALYDAALAALKQTPLKGICSTIEFYHGEAQDIVEDVKQMTDDFPAAYLLYGGSAFSTEGNNPPIDEHTLSRVQVAADVRGDADLRVMMHKMLKIVRTRGGTVLIDNQFGLDIAPLKIVRVAPLRVTKLFSIYQANFQTTFEMS